MVSIKKDNKGEFKEVTGLRTRKSSIYSPGQNETFKISRSKFSTFMDCKRCFYLDRVKGLQEPSMPGWALNTSVDALLKKEFDYYRERKEPHPIFKKYNLKLNKYIDIKIIKQLKELKELYDDGILTKEQFEKAKNILLQGNN